MGKPAVDAPENKPKQLCTFEKGKQYWTSASNGEGPLLSAKKGLASLESTPCETLPSMFLRAVKKRGNRVVLRSEGLAALEKGEKPPPMTPRTQWKRQWTYKEYYNDCRSVAKAMIKSGFVAHDACNIFGFNSPEWLIGMYGAILAGGKVAGLYGTDNVETVQFKSKHSNGSIAFVEGPNEFQRFKECLDDIPYMKAIVTWGFDAGDDLKRSDGTEVKTYTFNQFKALGSGNELDEELEKRIDAQKPSNACAIIYTSGTTGNPKAVMISHDNIIFETSSITRGVTKMLGKKSEEERIISYLPLSHVAGMMLDGLIPMALAVYTKGWASVNFARPYDLKIGTIGDRLRAIQPTLFFGVPRVWEKIQEKLLAVGAAMPDGIKKKLAATAKAKSLVYQEGQQLGGHGSKPARLGIYNILLKKIKQKLGLDKCKFMFAGAAPMTPQCLSYFGSIGINVNEVYGMSECCGACTFSTDEYHTWGTIGFEIPGVEVKIFKVAENGDKTECPRAKDIFNASEEEQGEICFRGRNTMIGYMANDLFGEDHVKEIEKKNLEAIDEEGWLHSGDKGAKDEHGMVKITGRYKELIIGAGGENIAPVPIEDAVKADNAAISNVVMIGNLRKFNVALVTLKCVGASGEVPGTDELDGPAAALSDAKTLPEAMKNETVIKSLTDTFTKVNSNGKVVVSNASKIQKFTILPRDFSVQTGELTATLKLKRGVVDQKYSDVIEKMYSSDDVYVPYE